MKTTILITSAGGLTGIFLSKHLSKNKKYNLIAIDMDDNNPLPKWVNSFYKVPKISESAYQSIITNIIKDNKVDIIIPVTSYDMEYYSNKIDYFNELNVKMLIMDNDINLLLSDKKTMYNYLSSLGISTPKVYEDTIAFPCFIKPRVSSGSKNSIKIDSKKDLDYWKQKINNPIVTEYLEGDEYTVDCLFSEKHKCLGYNVRKRLKTNGGGATITQNNMSYNISELILKLENTNRITGPVNFQFKVNNGEFVVFDFNTRFASGGLPLSVRSGFDIPNMLIDILLNKSVQTYKMSIKNAKLMMIRYYDEYYTK